MFRAAKRGWFVRILAWSIRSSRLKLAERYQRFSQELGIVLPVLFEINLSGEGSKSGWPAEEPNQWEQLFTDFDQILGFSNLKVGGLMTMPPFSNNPEDARPFFQNLRKLQGFLERKYPHTTWNELSMGTSFDFEIAI